MGNKSSLDKREEQFTGLTCPDCSGPLMSSQDGEFLEFRDVLSGTHIHRKRCGLPIWKAWKRRCGPRWPACASTPLYCAGWRPGVVMARAIERQAAIKAGMRTQLRKS